MTMLNMRLDFCLLDKVSATVFCLLDRVLIVLQLIVRRLALGLGCGHGIKRTNFFRRRLRFQRQFIRA
ncbi:hypothetical protein AL065_06725 [Pseudomonas amygdali pv. ulmi]|nr:hypothetical protein AL065_06725 [Pseudomonas amygdali pv. ulmi]